MTKKQVAELKEIFESYDKDGDNVLNFNEFKEMMLNGRMQSPDDINELFNEVDTNHSGTIDINEFISMMAQDAAKIVLQNFIEIDRDNNGYISKNELKELLNELEKYVDDEKLNEKFRKVDSDGDGQINYQEFEKVLESVIKDQESDDSSDSD